MKQFKGRPVAAGKCTAKALVSHNGFNTLASFQKSLQFGAKVMGRTPACLLFSEHIDSLAAAGAILSAVWTDDPMPTVDCLGEEFLNYVKDGMTITVDEDGTVTVED